MKGNHLRDVIEVSRRNRREKGVVKRSYRAQLSRDHQNVFGQGKNVVPVAHFMNRVKTITIAVCVYGYEDMHKL